MSIKKNIKYKIIDIKAETKTYDKLQIKIKTEQKS